ncbi:MAG: dodecin family protein [Bacteroidales bacterium]|jgi:flavin-binding protein dodecin|nr:dodecin family protein [Bacteroidales bacterium]
MAVLKVIEVLASSEKSWEDAAASAVKIASKTVKEIRSVYVQDMSAVVTKNKITEFRVTVKITFEVIAD